MREETLQELLIEGLSLQKESKYKEGIRAEDYDEYISELRRQIKRGRVYPKTELYLGKETNNTKNIPSTSDRTEKEIKQLLKNTTNKYSITKSSPSSRREYYLTLLKEEDVFEVAGHFINDCSCNSPMFKVTSADLKIIKILIKSSQEKQLKIFIKKLI